MKRASCCRNVRSRLLGRDQAIKEAVVRGKSKYTPHDIVLAGHGQLCQVGDHDGAIPLVDVVQLALLGRLAPGARAMKYVRI